MITNPLSTEDLTKVRLAPSPIWETVMSFWVLLHDERHTVHSPWATRARRVLPGTDLSPLLAAMCVEQQCLDFLSPPPDASVAEFDEELERLRATPPEVVQTEVETLGLLTLRPVLYPILPGPTLISDLPALAFRQPVVSRRGRLLGNPTPGKRIRR